MISSIRKVIIYIKRHFDFLLVDTLTFAVAYVASVIIRQSLDIRITHDELFLKFGSVAAGIFFLTDIASRNLNGVMRRGVVREAKQTLVQMVMTWSVYTVVLFLVKEAHYYSRLVYVTAFASCYLCVLFVRCVWKFMVKYTQMRLKIIPRLLVVCEADKTRTVLARIRGGSFDNQFEICGVVTNEKNESDYKDWYPYVSGLSHAITFMKDNRVQDAYVELDDAEEETKVIKELLDAGVIVHISLGDSKFNYLSQHISTVSGKSVITIEDGRTSLVSKTDQLINKLRRRRVFKKAQKLNR